MYLALDAAYEGFRKKAELRLLLIELGFSPVRVLPLPKFLVAGTRSGAVKDCLYRQLLGLDGKERLGSLA